MYQDDAAMDPSPEQESLSRPLHPSMVYQPDPPLAQPRPVYDEGGDSKPWKFPLHVIAIVRTLIFIFIIPDIVLSLRAWSTPVFAVIVLFLCLFWNVFHLLRYLHATLKSVTHVGCPSLPRFSFQCGDCEFSCGGNDDEDGEVARRLLDGGDGPDKKKRNAVMMVYRLVDFTFGLTLLITGLVIQRTGPAVPAIMFVISGLEWSVVIMSFCSLFGPATCFVYPDKDMEGGFEYRIRLPREPVTRQPNTGSQMSVAA